MAETMEAQARDIERLCMELQRTSIKQKDNIPELTPGSPEEFLQEERVTQWMRLCVGAMKESLDKVAGGAVAVNGSCGGRQQWGRPLQRSCACLPGLGGVVQVPYRLHDQLCWQGWAGAKRKVAVWIPG